MPNLSSVLTDDLIYVERPDKKIVCCRLFGATGIYAKNEDWLMRAI